MTNLFWTTFSVGGEKIAFFATTVYLARVLGVEEFGIFTAAQVTTMSIWLVVDLGVNRYGIKEIAKDKDNAGDIINLLMSMRLTAGLVAFALYSLSLYYVDLQPTQKMTMLGCGVFLISNALYTDWVFMGLERFKFITYGSLVSSNSFLLSCLTFVNNGDDIVLASAFWSFSYFFSSAMLLYILRKIGYTVRLSFQFFKWWNHLKESIYFVMSGCTMSLFSLLPILILSRLVSSHSLGIFSAPYRIAQVIGNVGTLVQSSFYPVLVDTFHNTKDEFLKVHRQFQATMFLLGGAVGIVGVVFGKQIVPLLFGVEYTGGVTIFQILAGMLFFRYLRFVYGTAMAATGFQRIMLFVTLCALVALIAIFALSTKEDFSLVMAKSILSAEIFLLATLYLVSRKTYLHSCYAKE